jgi:uncharacterized coiled-coil protein SlyX
MQASAFQPYKPKIIVRPAKRKSTNELENEKRQLEQKIATHDQTIAEIERKVAQKLAEIAIEKQSKKMRYCEKLEKWPIVPRNIMNFYLKRPEGSFPISAGSNPAYESVRYLFEHMLFCHSNTPLYLHGIYKIIGIRIVLNNEGSFLVEPMLIDRWTGYFCQHGTVVYDWKTDNVTWMEGVAEMTAPIAYFIPPLMINMAYLCLPSSNQWISSSIRLQEMARKKIMMPLEIAQAIFAQFKDV